MAGQAQAPNMMQAATNQYSAAADAYNAEQARQQQFMRGLFGLGGAAISAIPWSDYRLKQRFRREGTLADGTPVYSFEYLWGSPRQLGVMAQDVPHAARLEVRTGLLKVDYSALH